MGNIFKDIATNYFDFQKNCSKYELKLSIFDESNKKIENEMRLFTVQYAESLYKNYNEIKGLADNKSISFDEWIKYIIEYNRFLQYIEYCYLYPVSTEDECHVHINSDRTGICIDYSDKKINVEYKFEDSEILKIEVDSSTDPLLNYIENGEKGVPNDTITFVEIIANAKSFKFITNEEPEFNNSDDKILIDNIRYYTS